GKGGKDAGKGGGKNGGKSKTALKVAAGEKLFNGVIRMFNPEKKSGFIDCKDTQYQFAQDVYVFQDVLERGLAGPGDKVCFFLHWSAKGQPQASSPLLRIQHSAEGQYALKGHYKPREGADFGFIACEETREFFDRDVYVNKDIAVTLEAGQLVSFNCYLNRDGLPNAEEVVPCEEEWLPVPGDLSIAQQAGFDHAFKSLSMAAKNRMGIGGEQQHRGSSGDGARGAKSAPPPLRDQDESHWCSSPVQGSPAEAGICKAPLTTALSAGHALLPVLRLGSWTQAETTLSWRRVAAAAAAEPAGSLPCRPVCSCRSCEERWAAAVPQRSGAFEAAVFLHAVASE
ncbi:unnamed protein product, partial [Polarella glacialis]